MVIKFSKMCTSWQTIDTSSLLCPLARDVHFLENLHG